MNRAGGSSAVEQRTVKRLHAAILWSGVQISLPGFFVLPFSALLCLFSRGCMGQASQARFVTSLASRAPLVERVAVNH